MLRILLILNLVAVAVPLSLVAQQSSGWNSLPEETVAAVHVNLTDEVTKNIKNNTNLGKFVFNDNKMESLKQIMVKMSELDEEMASTLAEMRKNGFEMDDVFDIFNSNIGFGIIPTDINNKKVFTVLAWGDVKNTVSDKLYKKIFEFAGKEKKKIRNDIELDGQTVIHLYGGADNTHVMISRIGHRFVIGITNFDKNVDPYANMKQINSAEPYEKKNFTEGSSSVRPYQSEFVEGEESAEQKKMAEANSAILEEQLKGHYARFLMAQKGSGAGFAASVMKKPGIASAKPEGDVFVEAFLDFDKVIKMSGMGDIEKQIFGVDKLKAAALWLAFDGNALVSNAFLSTPKPRAGMLTLLEQPNISSMPPAWVPASANGYGHMSIDWVKIFESLKKIMAAQSSKEVVDKQMAQADGFLNGFLQTDLNAILNSMGKKVYLLDFSGEADKQSGAVVMEFTNAEIMNKAMNMMAPFMQGKAKRVQVQGFDGFIMNDNPPAPPIAVFYGKNHIIMGFDENSANTLISLISNPPKGADSLVNSPAFLKFVSAENPGKAIMFSYADGSRMGTQIYSLMGGENAAREMMLAEAGSAEEKALMKDLIDLIPTEKELNSIFGFSHQEIKELSTGFIFRAKTLLK